MLIYCADDEPFKPEFRGENALGRDKAGKEIAFKPATAVEVANALGVELVAAFPHVLTKLTGDKSEDKVLIADAEDRFTRHIIAASERKGGLPHPALRTRREAGLQESLKERKVS